VTRRKEMPFEDSPPSANAQWMKEKEYDNDELFFGKEDDDNWYKSTTEGKRDTNGSMDGSNPFAIKTNSDFEGNDNLPQRKSGVEPLFPPLSRKRKANDEDGVASIFGGNITPPISSASSNRISKIVIKMQGQQQHGDTKPIDTIRVPTIAQKLAKNIVSASTTTKMEEEESIVSSSSSSPPSSKSSPPSSSSASPPHVSSNNSSAIEVSIPASTTTVLSDKKLDAPIILKQGFSLVDYDESDDSGEEEDTRSSSNQDDEKSKKISSPKKSNNGSIGI